MMKKSMVMARKGFKKWKCEHPEASIIQKIKRAFQATLNGSEAKIGFHTLPSIITPMPEESVLKLKKDIEKLKTW